MVRREFMKEDNGRDGVDFMIGLFIAVGISIVFYGIITGLMLLIFY